MIGFCVFLCALCSLYGIYVHGMHSGTKFYMTWYGLAVLFILAGVVFPFLPGPFLLFMGVVVILLLIIMLICVFLIARHMGDEAPEGQPFMLVLGAQVRVSGPSRSLQHRLDTALRYLENNPETICVVSGGQGSNEPVSEASAMKDYLFKEGIDEGRILLEETSTSTLENLCFSGRLYDLYHQPVVIVTNDFHVCRSLMLAQYLGYDEVYGLSAPSKPLSLPNNMLREILCIMKEFACGRVRLKRSKRRI